MIWWIKLIELLYDWILKNMLTRGIRLIKLPKLLLKFLVLIDDEDAISNLICLEWSTRFRVIWPRSIHLGKVDIKSI